MDDLERDAVFFCHLLHPRHPIIRKRALVGIIKDKSVLGHSGVLGALSEFRRLGIRHKGQVHQTDPAVGYVCGHKALVSEIFRVGEKFPLPSLGAENADAFLFLRPGVAYARGEKVVRISVPFHRARDPQAVDVEPAVSLDGHPCVFRRDIFDKALAALLAAVKDQSLVKALLQPFLFGKALLA